MQRKAVIAASEGRTTGQGRSQPVVGERRGPCWTPSALMSSVAHRVNSHTVRKFLPKNRLGALPLAPRKGEAPPRGRVSPTFRAALVQAG